MTTSSPDLLLIDPDAARAAVLMAALAAAGWRTLHRADGFDGLTAVEVHPPRLVVVAWLMPFISGDIVLAVLRSSLDHPPAVIALVDSASDGERATTAGATAILQGAFETADLLRVVASLLLLAA